MTVSVMDVRNVRMCMRQRQMRVNVGVWRSAQLGSPVVVLVMIVVDVCMVVLE